MTALHTLLLSCNELEQLPAEIGNLKNIWFLYLGNNKLRDLPDQLRKLSLKLFKLYLCGNKIRDSGIKGITLGKEELKELFGSIVEFDDYFE